MEDSSNPSGSCKLGTPTKCSSSMTFDFANPFTKLLQDINDQSTIEKSWNCSLFCSGYLPNSTTNDVPSMHDLTFHMNSNNTFYEFPFRRSSSFMFDPNEFSGVKDAQKITNHLKQLCRDNGFEINVIKSYKSGKDTVKKFNCKHNRAPEEIPSTSVFHGDSLQQAGTKTQTMKRKKGRSQNRSKDGKTTKVSIPTKRKTRSFAPISEACRCKFNFQIFCLDDGNWFLAKKERDTTLSHFHHIGHVKTNPELLSISHKELTDDQLNLVTNCVELGLSDSIISKLLSREVDKDGILSREQIKYVRMKHEAEQIVADHQQQDCKLTSAEKLLNKFSNLVSRGEDIYYCALILDRHGEYLIRLPPGRPRKNQKNDKGDPNNPTCSANCEYKHKKSIILSCFLTSCLIIMKQFVSIRNKFVIKCFNSKFNHCVPIVLWRNTFLFFRFIEC